MVEQRRLGIGIALALILLLLTGLIELDRYGPLGLRSNGIAPLPLLLFDGLLLLTVMFFALALVVPQDRLALVQAAATSAAGVVLILGGLALSVFGLAELGKMLLLLFSFPFGTIIYFIKYICNSATLDGGFGVPLNVPLGNDCFDATKAYLITALLFKLAAFAALVASAPKFLTVKGLVFLVGLSTALAVLLFVVFRLLAASSLSFLLYPADALLTVLLGLVAAIYGVVTVIKGVLGLALALAAQLA